MPYRVAGVWAHPDDETYGTAGLLALNKGNIEYTLIVATSGEAGEIADLSLASTENLGQVREQEQLEALRVVGFEHADVAFLRYPDGRLADAPRDELAARIIELLEPARPQVVFTFGPEGVTKHPDHTTMHQAATEAFHQVRAGREETDAFERLYYVAIPESGIERFWQAAKEGGLDLGNPDDPFMPRGVPDHTITVEVDCSSVMKTKLEAIRAHRTQLGGFEAIPEKVRDELGGREWFVQAWPTVTEPKGPIMSSPFEGLKG